MLTFTKMVYLLLSFISISCEVCQPFKERMIVSRKQWDISSLKDNNTHYYYNDAAYANLERIILHHSAITKDSGPEVIKYIHLNKFGYDDIAYHFIIDGKGIIYEGRSLMEMGAHAGQTKEANVKADSIRNHILSEPIEYALKLDPDWGSIGICITGNFNFYRPTDEQKEALTQLLIFLKKKFNIKKQNILLHKDVKQAVENRGLTFLGEETECPGFYAEKVLRNIIESDSL